MRQVFLDTETTGLNAADGDRIVEIGCIEFVDRRETGRRLHHYVNPQRPSHPDALRVHGITDDFLADKPLFEHVADEIIAFIGDAELVIHNAGFDIAFLDAELARLGRGCVADCCRRVTDSLALARELFPGKGNSLDALCRRLEVDNSRRELHGALLDAGLLAEVYLRMTRGQRALAIDVGGDAPGTLGVEGVDLAALVLPVVLASDAEAAAHAQVLADIARGCKGGRAVWPEPVALA